MDNREKDTRGRTPELEELYARLGTLFARSESRARAADYVEGLLSGVTRKNSWQVAAHAGHTSPDGIQWLLTRAPWSAAALRDLTRDYVVENLGDDDAVVVFDHVAFPKRGDKSVGVGRQRSGHGARLTNCQLAVLMLYVSPRGIAIIDRELYLPRQWTDDPERRRAAGVPEGLAYTTRSQSAAIMLDRARRAGLPLGSVAAGWSCGGLPLRRYCGRHRLPHTEEIFSRHPVLDSPGGRPLQAGALARLIPSGSYHPAPGRAGGTAAMLRLAAGVPDRQYTSLLVRRGGPAGPHDRYFLCHAPRPAPPDAVVAVADTLFAGRDHLASARVDAGLDHYEVRKWEPWYRHVSLSLLAMAYLTVSRTAEPSPSSPLPSPRVEQRTPYSWPAPSVAATPWRYPG